MVANLNISEASKKIAFHPNRIFFGDVHWVIYRIRYEKKHFDDVCIQYM